MEASHRSRKAGRVSNRTVLVKICAIAYACEPGTGSEPGAGWSWSSLLSSFAETWVITRANNREPIEQALSTEPSRERLHFIYVDLPAWARTWKRGQRGVRLYYLLWQFAALLRARRLHARVNFDLAWHLTFANVWLGSIGPLIGPKFVYGPIGGGVAMPWGLRKDLGSRGMGDEVSREIVRALGRYLNPLARIAWSRSSIILVQNADTARWLPRSVRHKARVFPNVILDEEATMPRTRDRHQGTTAVFAGRILAWKGLTLAIRALRYAPEWRLIVFGRGPDEARTRRLAREIGVADRVDFRGWVQRSVLLEALREEADCFVFPSMHDDAGWVVAEALAAGVPVICLDRGGPPSLGGTPVRVTDVEGTARAIASRLALLPPTAGLSYDRDSVRKRLLAIIHPLLATGPPGASH